MFSFVDLFAGIGGFHATLGAVHGGRAKFASEWDEPAAEVYRRNWTLAPEGDIVPLTDPLVRVPAHDVLAAGFPCQPFSKSGFQRGINETRGTLFFNIMKILVQPEELKPKVVILENVRNLAGPRHRDTWATIVNQLQMAGYKVSTAPTIFSPHLLGPSMGGRPQIRERVFITATYVGSEATARRLSPDEPLLKRGPVGDWNPQHWDLYSTEIGPEGHPVVGKEVGDAHERYRLSAADQKVVELWSDFVERLRAANVDRLPGFPIWAEYFDDRDPRELDPDMPAWKADFVRKNLAFYAANRSILEKWLKDHNQLRDVPASRQKFEWQAQDAKFLKDTVMHLRPSGLRAKKPTYLPALVAITQTSILGARNRRLSPREAARLQGLPDWFDFSSNDRDALTYRQLGNGVNVGAASYVFRQHVRRDAAYIRHYAPGIVDAVEGTPDNPDSRLTFPHASGRSAS
jgi:DNA (cytosine-5)-methyltransferase 1